VIPIPHNDQRPKEVAKIEILGNYEGQKEKVRTGWIVKFNSTVAQLTTLYIIETVGRQIEGRGKFKQGLLQKMFV